MSESPHHAFVPSYHLLMGHINTTHFMEMSQPLLASCAQLVLNADIAVMMPSLTVSFMV